MSNAPQADSFAGYSPAPLAPFPEDSRPPRRRRPLLWAALGLPVIGWAALAMGAATPMKSMIARHASAALGRDVSIAGSMRLWITPFSLTISADRVLIANPDWAKDPTFLRAGTVSAKLATFDLLIGKPGFRALALEDGSLDLERSRSGKHDNWTGGKPGSLLDLRTIRRFDASRMAVRYRDPSAKSDAQVTLSNGGRGIVDLTGSGTMRGRDFTLTGTARSGEESATKFDIRARTQDFALALQGIAQGPLQLGDARLVGTVRGADFSRLAALGGIKLPGMADYDLTARIGHVRGGWHFSHLDGRIGQTDLTGALTLDSRKARPLVVAQLASRTLDMADLSALLSFNRAQPLDETPRLLPDATLSPKALRQLDAVIDYRAQRLVGIDHAPTNLALTVALRQGQLRVSPASVDLAGGFVSSDLFIDARRSPVLAHGDIRLSPTPMGTLLRDWGVAPAGTTAMVKGRIQLTGRGDTLREAIGTASGRIALILAAGEVRTQQASASSLDVANLSNALFDVQDDRQYDGPTGAPAPTGLHCGLIAFTVRNGVAMADPLLIDTDGSTLSGTGRLDLRDETLDMRLTAQGKRFGFFGRPSPVTISGALADPLVEREPIDWFRPASLFGLPMALPNLAAILGFVDPEEAKAPACGPILRGSNTAAQRERSDELASLP